VSTVNVTGGYTDIINVNSTELTSFIHGGLKNTIVKYNTTNTLGQCILNYSGMGSKKTLIIMASQLDVKSLAIKSLVTPPITSPDLITSIDSSMGSSSDYNVEIVYRSVIIDEMNYFCKLTLWWS
jgi:hypothetical protein